MRVGDLGFWFLAVLVLVLVFSAGLFLGLKQDAEYSVSTVALCEKEKGLEEPVREWKCTDHIVLTVNGYRTPIHEFRGNVVYRDRDLNKGFLGRVENQSVWERWNIDRLS